MKILNASQVRQTDAYTIAKEPIASIDLMERAATRFTEAFENIYSSSHKTAIFCGPGNNGGDGLAVARLLLAKGYQVVPFAILPKDGRSQDFLINFNRLASEGVQLIRQKKDLPDLSDYNIIIDAIFGSGLTRPAEGIFANVIEAINESSAEVVAIDIPSGLFMDNPAPEGAIIRAKRTISFQLPKLAFFLPENYAYVGEWHIVDIGLKQDFIAQQKTSFYAVMAKEAKDWLPSRAKFDHKGSFGHVQLIGGSLGKMGAMVLAAEAALRSGAGLVSANIPSCGHEILQTALPEAMLNKQVGIEKIEEFNVLPKANIIGLGPGLGTDKITIDAFGSFLRTIDKPLVIDADGLNILAERRDYLELLPSETVLTPHLKEFDRIAGDSADNWQRLEKARNLASKLDVIIILKGAHTAIIEPNKQVSFNTSGNPGMATAGSGDVLLGLLAGLRGQGVPAARAAKLGVFLHGLAGDLAVRKLGQRALIAGDILNHLGRAFLYLER